MCAHGLSTSQRRRASAFKDLEVYRKMVSKLREPAPPNTRKGQGHDGRARSFFHAPDGARKRKPIRHWSVNMKGTVVSKKDFKIMKTLFHSIDADGTNRLHLADYIQNVAHVAPGLVPMATSMFELLAQGSQTVHFTDFVHAAFPMLTREEIELQYSKHFPRKKELPVIRTAVEMLTESQRGEIRAIASKWDPDGNGFVSKREMRERCIALQIEQDFVDSWFTGCSDVIGVDELTAFFAETYNMEVSDGGKAAAAAKATDKKKNKKPKASFF